VIKEPNDPIIKVTSTNICGSDLHLYETMGASRGHKPHWCRAGGPADGLPSGRAVSRVVDARYER
jgi:threonine dehydrogenase-like Zn-dependent dehydrogenase